MNLIIEQIFTNSKAHPDRPYVIFEDDRITYSEFCSRAVRFAHYLQQCGVRTGDRVIVQARYSPWYFVACCGCHLAGAVFVPAEKSLGAEPILSFARHLDACFILSAFHFDEISCLQYQDIDVILQYSDDPGDLSFPAEDMIADIMFTTGTTGAPKGVMLTHKSIAQTTWVRVREVHIKEDNIGVTLVPLNHVAAMRMFYLSGFVGATHIYLDGITRLRKMFAFMDTLPVSSMYVPPATITLIQQLSGQKLHDYADQIDFVYTGSSSMQESQQNFMRKMLPNSRLYHSYGSSENGSVCLHRYDQDYKPYYCVGKPCVDTDVRIVDEDYNDVPLGQQGIVAIKSDMNLLGYWNRPELNAQVFRNGYFISNDVGYFDAEGFLNIVGRKDDIINISGLKVYPAEIEAAALKIKGVCECVCFRIPDKLTGNAAKLLLKTDESFQGTLRDIHDALFEQMDAYKVPKQIEFVDEIARTPNGKIDRKYYVNHV